jgi:hypothetical protein
MAEPPDEVVHRCTGTVHLLRTCFCRYLSHGCPGSGNDWSIVPKLVFHRYGDQYFLVGRLQLMSDRSAIVSALPTGSGWVFRLGQRPECKERPTGIRRPP